jgi:O-Antigen ligase
MTRSAQWVQNSEIELPVRKLHGRLSWLKFFLRYPIFLLAFGPPQFKASAVGGDTSQAHFGIWNILQVGWLLAIAMRAFFRLVSARSILIPRQIQSVLKYTFFLGMLFAVSVTYSPGVSVSAAFCVLYFLSLICVVEFLVDVYWNPPDWMQCIFQMRLVALVLFGIVFVCLPIEPAFVMTVSPDTGVRLLGGSIGAMPAICPIIAIISAYCFLYKLETRVRSMSFFLVSVIALAVTQVRGAEISLVLVLAVLGLGWAKTSVRSAYIVVSVFMASIILAGVVLATIGGGRIWKTFNKGGDLTNIITASGRTLYWEDLIQYSVDHPQGMGYIAGIRHAHLGRYAMVLHADLTGVGGTDNSYMEVLSDAGWLALALYLILLAKTIVLGLRFAKRSHLFAIDPDEDTRHAIRCGLLLFMFFLIEGMEGSDFVIPLRQEFYFQFTVIAVILGASTSLLLASRPRRFELSN